MFPCLKKFFLKLAKYIDEINNTDSSEIDGMQSSISEMVAKIRDIKSSLVVLNDSKSYIANESARMTGIISSLKLKIESINAFSKQASQENKENQLSLDEIEIKIADANKNIAELGNNLDRINENKLAIKTK